jgi:gas vesicle protein
MADNNSSGSEFGAFFAGILIGGLVGAATALLLAPQSGEETRRQLSKSGLDLRDRAQDGLEDARERAEATIADARRRAERIVEEARERSENLAKREGKPDPIPEKKASPSTGDS